MAILSRIFNSVGLGFLPPKMLGIISVMRNFEKPPQQNFEVSSNNQPIAECNPKQEDDFLHLKINEVLERAKEKTFSLVKYKGLKIKEYFGGLSEKEFDELLAFDYQYQLQDNLPINGTFSPEEELSKIKSLSGGQKKEMIDGFKKKLAIQREALANCRIFIERCIEFNPDTPKEKLMGVVEKFGSQYGFTQEQKQTSEKLLDRYYEIRQRVLEIRKRYPNDVDLVSELSGVKFDNTAKFDVSVGPMSVDIITDAFNSRFTSENSKDFIGKNFAFGGFVDYSKHEQPIPYVVMNKNRSGKKYIATHEHEHQKNALFREIFDKQINQQEEYSIFSKYESEQDPELKRGLLEAYFLIKRQEGLQEAKDEIIARTKGEVNSSYHILFVKNSPYDYFASVIDIESKKNDALWQEMAKRILVDEYKKILENAISAFYRLGKSKYTREEAIAIFADKFLAERPKTANRFLEQRA